MAAVDPWKELSREGCEFGRSARLRLESVEADVGELKRKLDRLTWSLVATAISFATAAIMLALNLVT